MTAALQTMPSRNSCSSGAPAAACHTLEGHGRVGLLQAVGAGRGQLRLSMSRSWCVAGAPLELASGPARSMATST
jgi:hypothetical protein